METLITKNEIIEQENRLYKAMTESSINTLKELLHDDLLFVLPSGEVITKEIDLRTYQDGALKINTISPKIEAINIIEDMAVVIVSMKIKGSYNAEPFEAKYRYIRFWKKFDEGIKVVGGSGTAI
ncbi:nuclear transport factor 2 family protein [Sphingobacterium olei]|uniref:Nuclear transport factor 2 family protein n=1 Tax=Sphingobacterium olei TaxID=2571155 RepID=A0A4U0NBR7_9SPHI|nr:nuclear transport factor 2 family protein [Sphingobacterium olei]TJZ51415.1 nuclear transport factor 2 family protein [Sphingobacterium olei]